MRGFYTVTVLTILLFLGSLVWSNIDPDAPFLLLVLLSGSIGALVREHLFVRELMRTGSTKADQYLRTVIFSPVTGGLLAILAGALFASGLIQGGLFPAFTGLECTFVDMYRLQRDIGLGTNGDLFKLLIWSAIAGFSERFVVSRIEGLIGSSSGPRPE